MTSSTFLTGDTDRGALDITADIDDDDGPGKGGIGEGVRLGFRRAERNGDEDLDGTCGDNSAGEDGDERLPLFPPTAPFLALVGESPD
jgi:hypothetical protein